MSGALHGGEPCAGHKMLLHACCGPCSLEPVRLLQEEGFDIAIAYVNPNIQPEGEYGRRLDTLRRWADDLGLSVIEGACDRDAWEREVACWGSNRPARCSACYRLRLREAASMAAEGGFDCLSTTLAVSPYQLFEVCGRELASACDQVGLTAIWRDFRPYYPLATQRSRELNMYRQNYCGCRFSAAEAALERSEAREERALRRVEERSRGMVQP